MSFGINSIDWRITFRPNDQIWVNHSPVLINIELFIDALLADLKENATLCHIVMKKSRQMAIKE
jgi:hypothetical protein